MKSDRELEHSPVVANSAMNRQRVARGTNSYEKDLGLDPIAWLRARATPAAWLDLCCGEGRALLEASSELDEQTRLTGVDLVGMFAPELRHRNVDLHITPLADWKPDTTYDLITCVHGLHYLGDKLGMLGHLLHWLKPDGIFLANFDADAIVNPGGTSLGKPVRAALRDAGFEFDTRRKIIRCNGARSIDLPFDYLGARDDAGPNYTGQPAVESVYENRS